METQKITVTLPRRLLKELDAVIPPRERSLFIAKAVQEQLAILEQAQAVDEAAGIVSVQAPGTFFRSIWPTIAIF